MNCQVMFYDGQPEVPRPATVLLVYPTGMQEPACDACARHWVNERPMQTRLAPLISYVDHYAQAMAQIATPEDKCQLQARREAFMRSCPEDQLRRYAAGMPTAQDMYELARCEQGAEAVDANPVGYYDLLAEQAQFVQKTMRYQVDAQQALNGRRPSLQERAIEGTVVASTAVAPPGPQQGAQSAEGQHHTGSRGESIQP